MTTPAELAKTPGITDAIRALLDRPEHEVVLPSEGDTVAQMAAKQLFRMIKGGNAKALEMLLDRLDGKVPQAVQADVKGDVEIRIIRFSDAD